ncbi:hypothetical protein TrVE_jg9294 [Triparma verrucosa]|uniref:Uncharacterized protein n=1 Tax=Triparma verrucosa TaxID=1606542 RepID=A0A9W7FB25_9STRA|nr:hypothetical protein TrVE_jg9294 [Triparma verrucosa]
MPSGAAVVPSSGPPAEGNNEPIIASLRRENEELKRKLTLNDNTKQFKADRTTRDDDGGTSADNLSLPSMGARLIVGDLAVVLAVLKEVMKPRSVPASLPVCDKSVGLTSADTVTLARGFDFLTKTSQNSDGEAVGAYLEHFPVMKKISEQQPLLEELLVFTSVRLAAAGKRYASIRLIFDVLLSTFDVLTDIYMLYSYYRAGESGFAVATLASLFSNIGVQLLLVFVQTRKQPKGRMFREMLYVLTFLKPGVDVYRVMLGVEKEVLSFADPKVEMFMAKGIELFAEAIPGAIIQSYAYLTGSGQTNAAAFSLVVSIFTAAFTSTGISFDKDLDHKGRVQSPDMYGYVPDGVSRRAKVFILMFCISASQLAVKAMAVALCAVKSSGGSTGSSRFYRPQ